MLNVLKKFEITVDNKSIFFYTDSSKCIDKLTNGISLLKTIPCSINYLGEYQQIYEDKNLLCFLESSEECVNIDKNNNLSFISGNSSKLFFPDLVYLLMCMFANKFQEENKYFLQASVVADNKSNGIMFIGDPASGKTTMSYLIARDLNGTIISNDNVLVGLNDNNLVTYAGSHAVQMRLGGIRRFCPEILQHINIDDYDNMNEWDTKIYIDDFLKQSNINFQNESTIKSIYFINTTTDSELVIREREPIDKLLIMYEHLTKQIRSNRYILTSFDTPIPSFEREEFMQSRYDLSKSIVENVPIYEAKGNIHKLVKTIERKI